MLWILYDKNGQIIKTWKPEESKLPICRHKYFYKAWPTIGASWYGTACVRCGKVKPTKTGGRMTVNQFAVEVSKQEGKKKQVNIGQIKELLRVINGITDGDLYRLIRKLV